MAEERMLLEKKRKTSKIVGKTLMIITTMATIVSTIYLAIFLKQFIDYRNVHGVQSSNPLHSNQNIDDAQFDSFGRNWEPLWRAFLIANTIAIIIYSGYILLAIYWHQYYVILLFVVFMFSQAILTMGSEYFSVPYRFVTIIYLITAIVGHGLCHIFRLDILDEMNAIKENDRT